MKINNNSDLLTDALADTPPGVPSGISPGVLDKATQVPSINCDDRPANCDISLIVVHNISLPPGEFGGPYISQLFTNQLAPHEHPYFADIYQLKVSSHLLIRRDGEIIQYVPFHKRAWHAGASSYCGEEGCNDFSIGIELEGADDIAYEKIQYETLAELIIQLRQSYPGIHKDAITGHSNIAPGRKTDPGPAFNWDQLHNMLEQRTD